MTELIDGVKVTIGRRDFIVPPLNLKAVKRVGQLVPVMMAADGSVESIDAAIEVIHLALKRNYPELTRDELEEELDLANLAPISMVIAEASGLVPKAEPGQTTPSESTGTPSTPG